MQDQNYEIWKEYNNYNIQCLYDASNKLVVNMTDINDVSYMVKKDRLLKQGFILKKETYDQVYDLYDAVFYKENEPDYKTVLDFVFKQRYL